MVLVLICGEKQAQELKSDVLLAIQGYTRSPGSANSLHVDSGQAFQGQKPWVYRLPRAMGLSMDRYLKLPLNVASVQGIMTPKCFVQVRPFVANFHPPGAARVLKACPS